MDIKLELFADAIKDCIEYKHINTDEINSRAVSALAEIQEVLQKNEGTDFDIVEKIVFIFEKYEISASPYHDFG